MLEIKVFIVTEVLESGGEKIIAARLTFKAARAVAKQAPNRRITRLFANKSETQ